MLTSNGNSDVATLSGDDVVVVMNGVGSQLYLSGNNGKLTLNGSDGIVGMYGNGNILTANGEATHITVGGQRARVDAAHADITVIDGTGNTSGTAADALKVTGEYNTVRNRELGARRGGRLCDRCLPVRHRHNVTLGTQHGSLTDTGGGNTVLVNAQDTSVTVASDGNVSATVNGLRNTVAIVGSSNLVAVNGEDSSITLGGTDNTLGTSGNSVSILDDTTGATLTGGAPPCRLAAT